MKGHEFRENRINSIFPKFTFCRQKSIDVCDIHIIFALQCAHVSPRELSKNPWTKVMKNNGKRLSDVLENIWNGMYIEFKVNSLAKCSHNGASIANIIPFHHCMYTYVLLSTVYSNKSSTPYMLALPCRAIYIIPFEFQNTMEICRSNTWYWFFVRILFSRCFETYATWASQAISHGHDYWMYIT